MRKLAALAVMTLVFMVAAPVSSAPVAPHQPAPAESVPPLTLDEPLFWHSDDALDTTSLAYDFGLGCHGSSVPGPHPCWAYRLSVADEAEYLRVAIDTNLRGQCYEAQLWAPGVYEQPHTWWWDGGTNAPHCPEYERLPSDLSNGTVSLSRSTQVWNQEMVVEDPKLGDWVVRVVPMDVTDWGFRLRALLTNGQVSPSSGPPDMRPHPPYEFGFEAPSHPEPGRADDHANEGTDPTRSCVEGDSHASEPLQRCLRFSAAVYNIGAGDLEIRFLGGAAGQGSALQYVRNADGSTTEHLAGEWMNHAAHDHRHYQSYARFELYELPHLPGAVHRLVAEGPKIGWNAVDQRLNDWARIDHGPRAEAAKRCLATVRREQADLPETERDRCMAQTRGWGDHYRWQRPGNVVEFPVDEDGENVPGDYVVVVTANPLQLLQETDNSNNQAYAWIRVEGDDITICERGYGEGPWDPKRTLAIDFWTTTPGGSTADSPSAGCEVHPGGGGMYP